MLRNHRRGLALALLAVAFGAPVYSRSINNSTILGIPQTNGISIAVKNITAENAIKLVCEHFGYTPEIHIPLKEVIDIDFDDVDFDDAIQSIIGNSSADYMLENNRLHLFKARESWTKITDKYFPNK